MHSNVGAHRRRHLDFYLRWTRENPSPILLKRISKLAEQALTVVERNLLNEKAIDIEVCLERLLSPYFFLILWSTSSFQKSS